MPVDRNERWLLSVELLLQSVLAILSNEGLSDMVRIDLEPSQGSEVVSHLL